MVCEKKITLLIHSAGRWEMFVNYLKTLKVATEQLL